MRFDHLKYLIRSDLYRYEGASHAKGFWSTYFTKPGFQYTFWMRVCAYLSAHQRVLYYPAKLMLIHYRYKFGILIPHMTQVGSGFYIGHFGGIVVNHRSVIGKNCTLTGRHAGAAKSR